MKIVLGAVLTLVVLGIVGAIVLFSGAYNIAASEPHNGLTRWAVHNLTERSIESRADQVQVPPLGDSAQLAEGFVHYDEMCVICRGAPGVERSEIGAGLNPRPPRLDRRAEDPAAAFWILKHGIKMTGMPAFGETHSDEQLWGIVAILQRLPELSPDEYAAMRPSSGEGAGAGSTHIHADGSSHVH